MSTSTDRQTAKVLLVDDRRDNLLALEAILQGLPVQSVGAHSGEEALKHLLVDDFALILLDAQMPDMDGNQTTRLIRRNPHFADLPVVFLTAKAMPGDRESSLAAGASDYITKPVDLDELLEVMAAWINGEGRAV